MRMESRLERNVALKSYRQLGAGTPDSKHHQPNRMIPDEHQQIRNPPMKSVKQILLAGTLAAGMAVLPPEHKSTNHRHARFTERHHYD